MLSGQTPSPDQRIALAQLSGKKNIFLTGRAGTGKSTVLRSFLESRDPQEEIAVLASTGAAAVLVGGRTFHSFFGLGILEGGPEKTKTRALENPRLKKRLKSADLVVIDEISMISGETLAVAEAIARAARKNDQPWGGLRIIAVGDFFQLPPVSRGREEPDWAFLHETWARSEFQSVGLETVHRTQDKAWLEVLNKVREGICDASVAHALNARGEASLLNEDMEVTRLFGRRDQAETFNLQRLGALKGTAVTFATSYHGDAQAVEQLKRNSPVPDSLVLKPDALVMIRRNETNGLYVNGSLGLIREIRDKCLRLELLEDRKIVEIEPVKFELLNADGDATASAKNFPLNLAYGSTIHKSQGATLDALRLRLSGLWESGQAYVALSRVRRPEQLYLDSWDARSIRADRHVRAFHTNLSASAPVFSGLRLCPNEL